MILDGTFPEAVGVYNLESLTHRPSPVTERGCARKYQLVEG